MATAEYLKELELKLKDKELSEEQRHHLQEELLKAKEELGRNRRFRIEAPSKYISAISKPLASAMKFNDPAWYLKLEYIKQLIGKVSFANALGGKFPIKTWDAGRNSSITQNPETFGGVCTFTAFPTINGSLYRATDQTSSIIAGDWLTDQVWKVVRGAQYRTTSYSKANLVQAIMAMFSIIMLKSFAEKLIGLAHTSDSTYNKYVRHALIQSNGIDAADLIENISIYTGQFNGVIESLASRVFPSGFSIVDRYELVFGSIIKDRNILKSQFYQFKPGAYLQWDEGNNQLQAHSLSTGLSTSSLTYNNSNSNMKFSEVLKAMINCYNSMRLSSAFDDINSDLEKAVSDGRLNRYEFHTITDDFQADFKCHDEILNQIKNMEFHYIPTNNISGLNIKEYASTRSPYQNIALLSSSSHDIFLKNHIIEQYNDVPSVEDVMVATRWKFSVYEGSGNFCYVSSCDSLFCGQAMITKISPLTGLLSDSTFNSNIISDLSGNEDELVNTSTTNLSLASQFDWFPRLYFVTYIEDSNLVRTVDEIISFGEVNNYQIVDDDIISEFNSVALASEFVFDKMQQS